MTPEMKAKLEERLSPDADGTPWPQDFMHIALVGAQAYESLLAEMAGEETRTPRDLSQNLQPIGGGPGCHHGTVPKCPACVWQDAKAARDDEELMANAAYEAGFDHVSEIHIPSYRCGFQTGHAHGYARAKAEIDRSKNGERMRWQSVIAEAVKSERERILNNPEIYDVVQAINLEAQHQRERWGSSHDAGKTDADWFWLIGYLAGKALHNPGGENEKKLHRIITVGAAALNWHAATLGKTDMRPGILNQPSEGGETALPAER